MTEGINDEQIDQMFVEFLKTPRAQRRSTNKSVKRSSKKLPRPEWMPESRSVRVTPRGAGQTSYWKALKVAEASLVERSATPLELKEHREQRDLARTTEELTARGWKAKPGQWDEEKRRDIIQKIKNVWL